MEKRKRSPLFLDFNRVIGYKSRNPGTTAIGSPNPPFNPGTTAIGSPNPINLYGSETMIP